MGHTDKTDLAAPRDQAQQGLIVDHDCSAILKGGIQINGETFF